MMLCAFLLQSVFLAAVVTPVIFRQFFINFWEMLQWGHHLWRGHSLLGQVPLYWGPFSSWGQTTFPPSDCTDSLNQFMHFPDWEALSSWGYITVCFLHNLLSPSLSSRVLFQKYISRYHLHTKKTALCVSFSAGCVVLQSLLTVFLGPLTIPRVSVLYPRKSLCSNKLCYQMVMK